MPNSKALMRNIGFFIAGQHGGDVVVITESAGGDGVEQSTDFVPRPDSAESVAVWIYGDVAIAAAQTLSLLGNLQDAGPAGAAPADLSADLGAPLLTTQVFDGDVSTAGQFLQRLGNFQLHGAREEIRAQYTLSYTGGTGEATSVVVFFVFAGTETGPAPQTTPNH